MDTKLSLTLQGVFHSPSLPLLSDGRKCDHQPHLPDGGKGDQRIPVACPPCHSSGFHSPTAAATRYHKSAKIVSFTALEARNPAWSCQQDGFPLEALRGAQFQAFFFLGLAELHRQLRVGAFWNPRHDSPIVKGWIMYYLHNLAELFWRKHISPPPPSQCQVLASRLKREWLNLVSAVFQMKPIPGLALSPSSHPDKVQYGLLTLCKNK